MQSFTAWPTVAELDEILQPGLVRAGVRLVQAKKQRAKRAPDRAVDAEALYETSIIARGELPTRANDWHDLLNAMTWASLPMSKRALTERVAALQRARIAGDAWKLPNARSAEHDSFALFDEGGLVVVSDEEIPPRPAAREDVLSPWIARAAARPGLACIVFGHAILEHHVAGMHGARAVALRMATDVASLDAFDAQLAAILRATATLPLRGPVIALPDAWFI